MKSASSESPDVSEDKKCQKKRKQVYYETENHWDVLTQMHGSAWPSVLPYCIFNVFNVLLIMYLKEEKGIDLTFSDRGHTFMSMMVSFLVVTRSNITYSRFMEARTDLATLTKSCRELIQHAITFTRYETSDRAKQWRADLARRTIVLLKTVVSVLEFETRQVHAWKVPELTKDEKIAMLRAVGKSNERSPLVLCMFMRSTISSQGDFLDNPMHVNKELRLYKFVSDFVTAYHGLTKLVTTPFPFPLVQMARTFLFTWIFTLPWVLVDEVKKLPALIMVVFFITYAFVGLEFVSIELDNPFGDDPNDFDVLGLVKVVFEDIYICIYDIDGKEAARQLRDFMEVKNDIEPKSDKRGHRRITSEDAWNNAAPSSAAMDVRVGHLSESFIDLL